MSVEGPAHENRDVPQTADRVRNVVQSLKLAHPGGDGKLAVVAVVWPLLRM